MSNTLKLDWYDDLSEDQSHRLMQENSDLGHNYRKYLIDRSEKLLGKDESNRQFKEILLGGRS